MDGWMEQGDKVWEIGRSESKVFLVYYCSDSTTSSRHSPSHDEVGFCCAFVYGRFVVPVFFDWLRFLSQTQTPIRLIYLKLSHVSMVSHAHEVPEPFTFYPFFDQQSSKRFRN